MERGVENVVMVTAARKYPPASRISDKAENIRRQADGSAPATHRISSSRCCTSGRVAPGADTSGQEKLYFRETYGHVAQQINT